MPASELDKLFLCCLITMLVVVVLTYLIQFIYNNKHFTIEFKEKKNEQKSVVRQQPKKVEVMPFDFLDFEREVEEQVNLSLKDIE